MGRTVVVNNADETWNKVARRRLGRPASRSVAEYGLTSEPVVPRSRAGVRKLVTVGSPVAKLLNPLARRRGAALLPSYQIPSEKQRGRPGGSGLPRV